MFSSSRMARSKDSKPLPIPTAIPVPDSIPPADNTTTTQHQRPSTSGTEAALTTSRRLASKQLRQAERAERSYKAKKRSAAARANAAEAKAHFRQAREHLSLGMKLAWAAAKGWPYVWRAKSEEKRRKRDEVERGKMEEKRRRLDEKLKGREEGDVEGKDEGNEQQV